jgi:hypothetical protein
MWYILRFLKKSPWEDGNRLGLHGAFCVGILRCCSPWEARGSVLERGENTLHALKMLASLGSQCLGKVLNVLENREPFWLRFQHAFRSNDTRLHMGTIICANRGRINWDLSSFLKKIHRLGELGVALTVISACLLLRGSKESPRWANRWLIYRDLPTFLKKVQHLISVVAIFVVISTCLLL